MSIQKIPKPLPIFVPTSKPVIESEPSSPTETEKNGNTSPCRSIYTMYYDKSQYFRTKKETDELNEVEPYDFCQENFEIPAKKAPCVQGTYKYFTKCTQFDPETPSYSANKSPDGVDTPAYGVNMYFDGSNTPGCCPNMSYDAADTPAYAANIFNNNTLFDPMSPVYMAMTQPHDEWYKGNTKLFAPVLYQRLRDVEKGKPKKLEKRKREIKRCEFPCPWCVRGE